MASAESRRTNLWMSEEEILVDTASLIALNTFTVYIAFVRS